MERIKIHRGRLPLSHVYNQWTQLEECPTFMDGMKEVRRLDGRRSKSRREEGMAGPQPKLLQFLTATEHSSPIKSLKRIVTHD